MQGPCENITEQSEQLRDRNATQVSTTEKHIARVPWEPRLREPEKTQPQKNAMQQLCNKQNFGKTNQTQIHSGNPARMRNAAPLRETNLLHNQMRKLKKKLLKNTLTNVKHQKPKHTPPPCGHSCPTPQTQTPCAQKINRNWTADPRPRLPPKCGLCSPGKNLLLFGVWRWKTPADLAHAGQRLDRPTLMDRKRSTTNVKNTNKQTLPGHKKSQTLKMHCGWPPGPEHRQIDFGLPPPKNNTTPFLTSTKPLFSTGSQKKQPNMFFQTGGCRSKTRCLCGKRICQKSAPIPKASEKMMCLRASEISSVAIGPWMPLHLQIQNSRRALDVRRVLPLQNESSS